MPASDKNVVQLLAKEMKSIETENLLMKQEVAYVKEQLETSQSANKILEQKLSIISNYFKEAISKIEDDDPLYKRYKILLGTLTSNVPSGPNDLWAAFDHQGSPKQNSSFASGANTSGIHHSSERRLAVELQTFDSSNRSSSNLNISTDGRRKRDKLLKAAKNMRHKCEGFLKRFEEVEEAERLAKIKNIEETRKQANLNKGGSLLNQMNEQPTIQSLIASISHRSSKVEPKASSRVTETVPATKVVAQPTSGLQSSSSKLGSSVFRQSLHKSSSLAWMMKGAEVMQKVKGELK